MNMRNTVEYPITKEEIAEYLKFLAEEIGYDNTGRIGDMGPLLLEKARDIVLTGKFDPT